MKKYITPATELVAVETLQPMVASNGIYVNQDGTVINPSTGQWARGRKGYVYIDDDDED